VALPVLIVILAIAGLADALYFTFAYYGRIKKAPWVPEILCAREGSKCVTVLQTPYARVLGMPNSLLGIIYYLLLIGWGLAARRLYAYDVTVYALALPLRWVLAASSAMPVIAGFHLIHALRHKLHIACPLCYTAHAINAALFVLLIVFAF
jgi:uncharacterized membrane protein